jgi:sigma-B regulation protein RsbU (phosphoserine phosphatase)
MDKAQRPKILIVDDEPFNIDFLEQEFEELNCNTIRAGNGQEALEQVAVENPDIILLDIMMPEMDGFEVLAQLKANPHWRHIPVIIISAMHELDSVVKGIQLGAEDYLPKPFSEVLLKARMSACLERKRLRDQEQLYLRALERELEIGHEIQAGFLPDKIPQLPGWEMVAHFQAAREVAGDFYDVFTLPAEARIGLVVADVSDKGVGAALYMTLFRSLLRALSNLEFFANLPDLSTELWPVLPGGDSSRPGPGTDGATRLKNAVTLTNNYVAYTHDRANMFVTFFFGLLDPLNGCLTYINAGHEPPLVLDRAGVKFRLMPTGPIVGIFPNIDYRVAEVYLEQGDILLAFTDGVTDAQNSAEQMFTKEKLLALLEPATSSANVLLSRIETALHGHIGEAPQYDDITMLVVQRLPVVAPG